MLFQCKYMMLVHLLILLRVVDFCHCKSLNYRGERVLDHRGTGSQYRPLNRLKINSKYLSSNDFYRPSIHGQPIYVPPLSQSANDMDELLDSYYSKYKIFSQTTPVPYSFEDNESNYYGSPVTVNRMVKNFFDEIEDGNHGSFNVLPTTKSQLKNGFYQSSSTEVRNNYADPDLDYVPQVVDMSKIKKSGHKISNHGSVKVVAPGEYYAHKLVGGSNLKKPGKKNPSHKETESVSKYADLKGVDYDEYYAPEVVRRTNVNKPVKKDPFHKEKESVPEYGDEKYESPDEYYAPEVVGRTNLKKPGKKGPSHKETESVSKYADLKGVDSDEYYAPEAVRKTNLNKPVKDPFDKEKEYVPEYGDEKDESPDEYYSDEYYSPEITDKTNIKKSGNKSPVHLETKDAMEYHLDDVYKRPVNRQTVKEIIRDTAIAEKQEDKKSKKESELEYLSYEKPIVHKTLKQEKAKHPTKHKSKGKLRKQANASENYETSSEYTVQTIVERENLVEFNDNGESLDIEHEALTKVKTKNKVVIKLEPKETAVKIKEKVVTKSKPKETPVKTKVVVKADYASEDPNYSITKTNKDIADGAEISHEEWEEYAFVYPNYNKHTKENAFLDYEFEN